jgi:nucleotide-binding universal stress UspA family protein
LDFALHVASSYGAHVIGVFIDMLPLAMRTESSSLTFARGEGVGGAIDSYFAPQEEAAARLQRVLQSGARELGASAEWRHLSAHASLREAVIHCTYSDLLILPPQGRSSDGRSWSSADLVFTSGVPGIVVPGHFPSRPTRRALVAWNASRVARRAVGDALPFLMGAENVTIVTIDADIGVHGHGEEPGSDVARFLARHGVRTAVEQIKSDDANVADELARCVERLDVDLVVAGAYGHSRIVEVVLGSTTRRILHETKVPVFISH